MRNETDADVLRYSGLEADQKTIAAHGCYAMACTTALTAQDTTAVYDIHHVPPQFVARQVEICIKDIGQDAVKIGMLASGETAAAVAKVLVDNSAKNIVVDPVGPHSIHPSSIHPTSASRILPA
ncbi:bifunctional hydroxymethylpyrimidine kinase/phosphomethylpyrimidine kinase [Candidatus Bathyarchaeota archaeon]|nr:bifunctional hydroxymethylpyrimidine kinase/phosphomethylpyrimidine kinase [Candidatus Bathyarchaeota archaeon]